MTEPLPNIELEIGRDRTVDLVGPGVDSFDWDNYATGGLVCTELGIEKDTSDATEAEITTSGKTLRVHFLQADIASAYVGLYRYSLYAVDGSGKEHNVGGEGTISVAPAS